MRRLLIMACLPLAALTLAACGASTVSTSGFKGEQQAAAKVIANLQSQATAGEQGKICESTLATSIVSRLGGSKGCEKAIKEQLGEVDSLEVTVQSVQLSSGGDTANASVLSVQEGKKKERTVALVKEGGTWKISGLG